MAALDSTEVGCHPEETSPIRIWKSCGAAATWRRVHVVDILPRPNTDPSQGPIRQRVPTGTCRIYAALRARKWKSVENLSNGIASVGRDAGVSGLGMVAGQSGPRDCLKGIEFEI